MDLEFDENDTIFQTDVDREQLRRHAAGGMSPRRDSTATIAQVSPRRGSASPLGSPRRGALETTTLPFYQNISPTEALEKLFDTFHTQATVDENMNQQEEEAITLAEFNQLRRCVGRPEVSPNDWKRALEELGRSEGDAVPRSDFKALFGPPPYFGSPTATGIVREILRAEEHIHFAQMLFQQFSTTFADSTVGADANDAVQLPQLQELQRKCGANRIFTDVEWADLCSRLNASTNVGLTWMKFCEAFYLIIKKLPVFAPYKDPPETVYAVLAGASLLATFQDPEEDSISRKAFSNLLRVKRDQKGGAKDNAHVDDEAWIKLLQSTQDSYSFRKGKRLRRNSSTAHMVDKDIEFDKSSHGHDQPMIVVHNTNNQVMSYEIVYDEHGSVGLTLQSDFRGQCVVVADISEKMRERYPIIKKFDIVAAVNGESLIASQAPAKEREQDQLNKANQLLAVNDVRKITFLRQESYYSYKNDEKYVELVLNTYERIDPMTQFLVSKPNGGTWKLSGSLRMEFVSPDPEKFADSTAEWNSQTESILITIISGYAIEKNSEVVIRLFGVDCGDKVFVGPCDLSEGVAVQGDESEPPTPVWQVTLYTGWAHREGAIGAKRLQRVQGNYSDKSLDPHTVTFAPDDPGFTLSSDFFGQCVVVDEIDERKQAKDLDVQKHDILASITVIGERGANTVSEINCIKPFELDKKEAKKHLKKVKEQLTKCYKPATGNSYILNFLRLNSYFFYEKCKTSFTFRAPKSLSPNASLVIKFPSAQWRLTGTLVAKVSQPLGLKVKDVYWDSQHQSVHAVLAGITVLVDQPVTIEIDGIVAEKDRCAGPGEIVGVQGDSAFEELEFELHEHWHSFLVGHQGIDPSKVMDTLKTFKTSPELLWRVLEYTSKLFDMFKEKDSDHMSLADLNRMIHIITPNGVDKTTEEWTKLCRDLGAKPLVGLTRQQFACCWYDVVDSSLYSAEEIYKSVHTAERLFEDIKEVFQGGDGDVIFIDTIERLPKILTLPSAMLKKCISELTARKLDGWDFDTFRKILCGAHPMAKLQDKAADIWVQFYYMRVLFNEYSANGRMKKRNMQELFAAAKLTDPKFTNELWSEVCDAAEIDETNGLDLANFMCVYTSGQLGSRHALADWYRIETFKVLPTKKAKEKNADKEAALNTAPDKVDIKEATAKILEETTTAEDLFKDLLKQEMEFSKLVKVEDTVDTDFVFRTKLRARQLSRSKGFLHVNIRRVLGLSDRLIHGADGFNDNQTVPEELYAMFFVTDHEGLKLNLPPAEKRNPCLKVVDTLFGEKNISKAYEVYGEDLWDDGSSQELMEKMHTHEVTMQKYKQGTEKHKKAKADLKELEKLLISGNFGKYPSALSGGRIFSSIIVREESADAVYSLPKDKFRLYIDMPELPTKEKNDKKEEKSDEQKDEPLQKRFLVCRLFKRLATAKSKRYVEWQEVDTRIKKLNETHKILKELLDKQQLYWRHVIAQAHKNHLEIDDETVQALAKLKQKKRDVDEIYHELQMQKRKAAESQLKIEEDNAKFELARKKKEEKRLKKLAKKKKNSANTGEQAAGEKTGDAAAPGNQDNQDDNVADDKEEEMVQGPEDIDLNLGGEDEPGNQEVDDANGEQASPRSTKRHWWQKAKQEKKPIHNKRVRFIGQTYFELGELLRVLHNDDEYAGDLGMLTDEEDNDIGRMLLGFKYKCESIQQETEGMKLPQFTISMSSEDKDGAGPVQSIAEEQAREYPSHAELEIRWEVETELMVKDRLCVVREDDDNKFGMPYFLAIWNNPPGRPNDPADWIIPDVAKKMYTSPFTEAMVQTNESRKSGKVLFPSSSGLSLPPGRFKVCLIRNDMKKQVRALLGSTKMLAVLPGRNSIHTQFGTTPLVEVKPLSVVLQVYADGDVEAATSSETKDGMFNKEYLEDIQFEQEMEVLKRELSSPPPPPDTTKPRSKRANPDAQSVAHIQMIMEDLRSSRRRTLENRTLAGNNATSKSNKSQDEVPIVCTENTIVSFQFSPGHQFSPQDRIVILPEPIVRASDMIRSTLLGKLQGNDSTQVKEMRVKLAQQLAELSEVLSMKKSSLSQLPKVFKRWVSLRFGIGTRVVKNKSDTYKAQMGIEDDAFVWNEIMETYKKSPKIVKKHFLLILGDLLDEISARQFELQMKIPTQADPSAGALRSRVNAIAGLDIPVSQCEEITRETPSAENPRTWIIKTKLGHRFVHGGFFVGRYIRRSQDSGWQTDPSSQGLQYATAGELCRYGPFFVTPALYSYSKWQVIKALANILFEILMTDEVQLVLKFIFQFFMSTLKYFLQVVALSFNVNVLANNFKFPNAQALNDMLNNFETQLARLFGPIEIGLSAIYKFFSGYIQKLMDSLQLFDLVGECYSGFFLYGILYLIFAATFIVYVVVQEDFLVKVQKLHTYIPANFGKAVMGFFEQLGSVLVIPMYLAIKTCVLFISRQWLLFYNKFNDYPQFSFSQFDLHTTTTAICTNAELAKINYGFGVAALVLIVIFLFILLPLLLLDVFSWVPLSELLPKDELEKKAHSRNSKDIHEAVHSNANLVELKSACCPNKVFKPSFFSRFYADYMGMKFADLFKKHGLVGLFFKFTYMYSVLMFQSMGRSIGIFLGWRHRGEYMYKHDVMASTSRWRIFDAFCLRFNIAWKIQYIKSKIFVPFINIIMVTLGLWGEDQWKEFNIEERADDCFRLEPSAELKQLNLMTLHGKIVSLFWLCVPRTTILAYLAEVLNRGPMFSYFINKKFLQADIPESEREKDPVWRFWSFMAFAGEDDVIYLSDTRFISTVLKWGSAMTEIAALLSIYSAIGEDQQVKMAVALLSALVAPILEFNQQLVKTYVDYMEKAEKFGEENNVAAKYKKIKEYVNLLRGILPAGSINLKELTARRNKNANQANAQGNGQGNGQQANGQQANGQQANGQGIAQTNTNVHNGGDKTTGQQPEKPVEKGNDGVSGGNTTAKPAPEQGTGNAATSNGAARPPPVNNQMKSQRLVNALDADSATIEFGGGSGAIGEKMGSEMSNAEEEAENAFNEEGGEGAVVAGELALMLKPKKDLIALKAMPQVSYVVTTDGLSEGEGEITVSWNVNAKQRFHALDAIGMFPAKIAGDTTRYTMEDCICYRLLKEKVVEDFGWRPKPNEEDAERHMIIGQASALRKWSEREAAVIAHSLNEVAPLSDNNTDEAREHMTPGELLLKADKTMTRLYVKTGKLKPLKQKLPDLLEEEVVHRRLADRDQRLSRASSKRRDPQEQEKRARKDVNGQVKFRPVNSEEKDEQKLETFVYGNDAGIYQSKYGLHSYQFCYLRYNDPHQVGTGRDTTKVSPSENQSQNYEILEKFTSNEISIGTFNIFMNLTCDQGLVGANQTLNLTWIIYGIDYLALASSKLKHCIGFYKIDDKKEDTLSKIEIIPSSAYLEVNGNQACPGRMIVTSPREPGMYEIRFLFNFLKNPQLHRQCQVFGELEDQMQYLRIRSFYEKRAVSEEIRKFGMKEPTALGIARMNAHSWLRSMLLSMLREPVDPAILESTSEYSDFLQGRLQTRLKLAVASSSKKYQRSLRRIVSPFQLNSFMEVMLSALNNNAQLNDQLASITFLSPTEDDEKHWESNPLREQMLLPRDSDLMRFGTMGFKIQAKQYLRRKSLCGYFDLIDDTYLNQQQMRDTVKTTFDNLSSSCVTLFESCITRAIEDLEAEAELLGLSNALAGIGVILADRCRNHIQSILRAFLETDCYTGKRWPGPPKAAHSRMQRLRMGSVAGAEDEAILDAPGAGPAGFAPITREHIAVRRWIFPKLIQKIMGIFKQRHARLLSGNLPILKQFAYAVCFRVPPLEDRIFPNHRTMRTDSPLYFLGESRGGSERKGQLDDQQQDGGEGETAEDAERERAADDEEKDADNDRFDNDDDDNKKQGQDDDADDGGDNGDIPGDE
ncbi:TPA: hypothetical protein N0F65_007205 [Lagenidium giganteum]|uniref:Calmodulin n=1 Tax=Lagenidium giganteum TaxID=4803 RepID=A0AAV2Z7V2_9STRA|nr:TPA: hypothetical protein N0F65_007205 [Lagenidium giganteum]